MKMEQTECSETSAYKIQTPGNYPKESIQVKVTLQLCNVTHRVESEGLNKAGGRHVVCDVKRVDLLCDFIIFPFSDILFRGRKSTQ